MSVGTAPDGSVILCDKQYKTHSATARHCKNVHSLQKNQTPGQNSRWPIECTILCDPRDHLHRFFPPRSLEATFDIGPTDNGEGSTEEAVGSPGLVNTPLQGEENEGFKGSDGYDIGHCVTSGDYGAPSGSVSQDEVSATQEDEDYRYKSDEEERFEAKLAATIARSESLLSEWSSRPTSTTLFASQSSHTAVNPNVLGPVRSLSAVCGVLPGTRGPLPSFMADCTPARARMVAMWPRVPSPDFSELEDDPLALPRIDGLD